MHQSGGHWCVAPGICCLQVTCVANSASVFLPKAPDEAKRNWLRSVVPLETGNLVTYLWHHSWVALFYCLDIFLPQVHYKSIIEENCYEINGDFSYTLTVRTYTF